MVPKACLQLLLLVSIVSCSTSSTCPANEVLTYFEKRANASQEVVGIVGSSFGGLNVTNGTNATQSLYSAIASANSVPKSETGMKNFNEALDEITNSYFTTCQGSGNQQNGNATLKEFLQRVANFNNTRAIRQDYGKLLCIQQQSGALNSGPKPSQQQKRSTSVLDCASSATIQELYQCLDSFDVWPCIFNIDPTRNDCPESTTQNQLARNCLAFVVDTTGSMAQEIAATKQIIRQFIQSEENALTFCYVLVAFNDYGRSNYVGNLQFYRIYDAHYISTDPNSEVGFTVNGGSTPVYGTNVLLNDVNSLYAHGGGNCPEYGMIGILKAIELMDSIDNTYIKEAGKHNVIVLTDASARDNELYPYVIGNATKPNGLAITVHFFYSSTGGCGGTGYGNYPDISNATCGFGVKSISSQAFTQFANYLYLAQQEAGYGLVTCVNGSTASSGGGGGGGGGSGGGGGGGSGDVIITGTSCVSFNVSLFASNVAALIQGSRQNPILRVTLPDGTTQSTSITGDFAVYQKANPQQGLWRMCFSIGVVIDFSLSISMDLGFDVNYVLPDEETGRLYPTLDLPYSCDVVSVILETTQIENIDFNKTLEFQLVHVNGTAEVETELTKCNKAVFGSFKVPKTASPLYYQVKGSDIGGIRFQEILSSRPVSFPKTDILVIPLTGSESFLLSTEGENMFQYQYSLQTKRRQPVQLVTQWSLHSNDNLLHKTPPTMASIMNGQYINISLDTANYNVNSGDLLNWTLTTRDECSGNQIQERTYLVPVTVVPPLDVKASTSCSADVIVQWNSLSDDAELHYNVSVEYDNGTVLQHTRLLKPGLTISNLTYNESVQVILHAGYRGGKIFYKKPHNIRNNPNVPSPPRSLKARDVTSSSSNEYRVELEWLPPNCMNSKSVDYEVYYRGEDEPICLQKTVAVPQEGQLQDVNTTNKRIIVVSGPGNYTFKVSGVNEAGVGTESVEVKVIVITRDSGGIEGDPGATFVNVGVPILVCIIALISCVIGMIIGIFFYKRVQRKRYEEHYGDEYEVNNLPDDDYLANNPVFDEDLTPEKQKELEAAMN